MLKSIEQQRSQSYLSKAMQFFSKRFYVIIAAMVISILPVACVQHSSTKLHSHSVNDLSDNVTDPEHHYFHKTERPHAAEWGYKGDIGPKHWGDLSSVYILAKQGKQQSPIDISKSIEHELPNIIFNYRPAKINLVYNGHTIEEEEETGSHIQIKEEIFELKQFHFHAPSEHTINGKHADMEMHLVHKANNGTVVVVAVMINRGDENRSFTSIWENLPTSENADVQVTRTVDATDLLPSGHTYYQYRGSFTTPPCAEGVIWYVLTAPIELSHRQIDEFKSIINNNNRPIQPLNEREIYLSE